MADLQTQFEAAVAHSRNLTERPDNATLLKVYGLFKQATEGDNHLPKPGISDMVGLAKWQAWEAAKGLSAELAMQQYIALVDSLD